jgi:molecular chaperone HscB
VSDVITSEVNSQQAVCRYCGTTIRREHFCPGCEKIQGVSGGIDYFSFFELPRKLGLDRAHLEKQFYSLSRRFHPDYFMNASEAEREASVERSSLLNDAYRTLRDPVLRASYLLSLEGYKEAEKKAPPDLLEEVFELNLQIEELRAARRTDNDRETSEARAGLEQALGGLKSKLEDIDRRLLGLFDEWDRAVDRSEPLDKRKLALDRLSELLSYRSYIRNVVADIQEEL